MYIDLIKWKECLMKFDKMDTLIPHMDNFDKYCFFKLANNVTCIIMSPSSVQDWCNSIAKALELQQSETHMWRSDVQSDSPHLIILG